MDRGVSLKKITGPDILHQGLRWGVLAGIALLLFTPFVVSSETLYSFVVGKALWSRSIIEIVFALWAVLALVKPAYRPPQSWLLIALAGWVAVCLLAAGFGVSLQRSLWSTYERMQGVVDLMHWLALAVVLVSMLRTTAAWRALLTLNLAVSLVMACLVIGRYHELGLPLALPEPYFPRMSGPLGNPIFLSFYMLASLLMALGFLVRSCLPIEAPPSPAPRGKRRKRRDQGRKTPGHQHRHPVWRWLARGFWAVSVAFHFWGLSLAGSAAGLLSLLAGVGFLALAYTFLQYRGLGWALIIALGTVALLLGIRSIDPTIARGFDNPIAKQISRIHFQFQSLHSRLAVWETGLEGFAERPFLGWGPGNFEVAFGHFAKGYSATIKPHDNAHAQLVEVATTTGALGLTAYLALWGLTFTIVLRAARRMNARNRTLALFAGAALAGMLLHNQAQFQTASGWLQTILLLGFVASLEASAFPDARRPRLPRAGSTYWGALLRYKGVRLALAGVAIALCLAGLMAHQAIHAATHFRYLSAGTSSFLLAEGINRFKPLGNIYRWHLFNQIDRRWHTLRGANGTRTRNLLGWAGREAQEVERTEPQNWRIHHSLARMYRTVADTDPEYEAAAQHYLERAQALAPNREVFFRPLSLPDSLEVHPLADGRFELRWKPSEGVNYYELRRLNDDIGSRVVHRAHDPSERSFIPPGTERPGTHRFAIQACGYSVKSNAMACTPRVEWPPFTVPATATDPAPD